VDGTGSNRIGSGPDPVRSYFDGIGGRSLLDRDEEARLGRAVQEGLQARRCLADNSDLDPLEQARLRRLVKVGQQARQRFVEANLRLVVFVAKRYRRPGIEFQDLIQEGNLGLIRAVEKFDWQRGFKFSTYATWWIRQAISRGQADRAGLIRLPRHAQDQAAALLRTRDLLSLELRREPTLAETAVEAGLDAARAAEILRTTNDQLMLCSEPGNGHTPLVELLADEAATDPIDGVVQKEQTDQIRELLDKLDHREAAVLELRYGLDGNPVHTLEQVAHLLGVSRERARQIETRALLHLRHDPTARTLAIADAT
jgi:RNA polymerase sigma factor (sigma-70 family)